MKVNTTIRANQISVFSPEPSAHLEYWQQQLKGIPPFLELPTDRPRPLTVSWDGAAIPFELSNALAEKLKGFSRQEDADLFVTLLAAFSVLLQRYSRQEDILIGTPNTHGAETAGLTAQLANPLVLRVDLSAEKSGDGPGFHALLNRVRQVVLDAYAHPDVPFRMLVDALQPQGDMSHHPLCQVMFTFQSLPAQAVELPGLSTALAEAETGAAPFDLVLSVHEQGEQIAGVFHFNAHLFDPARIERMAAHFLRILEAALDDPDLPVEKLPMLGEEERQQILGVWNQTRVDFHEQRHVPQLFEAQAARAPDAPALTEIATGSTLTYAGLNARANQIAHYLRRFHLQPGTLVAIGLGRSNDAIACMLAIWKAGGAYLPIEPDLPADRMRFILEDSCAAVLITNQALADQFPPSSAQVIYLDTEADQIRLEPSSNPELPIAPDQAAYVIYTSGSTGRPKGVVIEHHSLLNHNLAYSALLGLTPADRVLQFFSLTFDPSIEDIFPTLINGAQVVVRPSSGLLTAEDLMDWITKWKLTVLTLPTAFWHVWVDKLSTAHLPRPETLRLLGVGGEKAFPEKLTLWQAWAGSAIGWMNLYGPTEATIVCTAYCPTGLEPDGPLPIGKPLANMRTYVLDQSRNLLPAGVPGELYIAGAGIARGYLNRPELTAEKFLPDPFTPGERMYRTGDLVSWLPDGNIDFVGRVDFQVKINGYRVELSEVETHLRQHPGVADAVVGIWEDSPGNKRLVAYIVADPGNPPSTGDLGQFLKARLPHYMVPSIFMLLDEFPMLPSGKVNRRALPAPDRDQVDLNNTYLAPRTPEETALVEIWQQVLGLARVGVQDNFFDLGGNSLQLIGLMTKIEHRFGKEVPMNIFFEAATIAELAKLLTEKGSEVSWSCLVSIQPNGKKPPFFLIHGEGAVLIYQSLARALGPDQPVYGLQAVGLDGKAPPLTRVEDMAARYIQEIRQMQPHGPYYVGAYALGGIIALEVARQLSAAGEKVGLLALLETYGPGYPAFTAAPAQLKYKAIVHLHKLRTRSLADGLKYLQEVLSTRLHRIDAGLVGGVYKALKRPLPHRYRYEVVRMAIESAVSNYHPAPYEGVVTLFRATVQPPGSRPDRYLGLKPLASQEIEVIDVTARHTSLIMGDVDHLVKVLAPRLPSA